jgi:plasmid maintenance system antidote protein VapI
MTKLAPIHPGEVLMEDFITPLWINLQNRYDFEVEKDVLGDSLDSIRPLRAA